MTIQQATVIEAAEYLERVIAACRQQGDAAFLELGAYLADAEDIEAWRHRGYDTMASWWADPEVNVQRTTGYRLIRVTRRIVRNDAIPALERHRQRLAEIGIAKLDRIGERIALCPDEAVLWLRRAETLSESDLIAVLNSAKGIEPPLLTESQEQALAEIERTCRAARDGRKPVPDAFDHIAAVAMHGLEQTR